MFSGVYWSQPVYVSVYASVFAKNSFPQSPSGGINPFPNSPFWDRPKFREGADDNWNVNY